MIRLPHRLVQTGLALVVLLGAAAPAPAQDPQPSDPAAPEQDPGPGEPAPGAPRTGGYPQPTLHGELSLSLADAIRMGLENNLDVEVVRYDPYVAYEETEVAWGAYDPVFASDFGYDSVDTPNANQLVEGAATTTRSTGGASGLRGTLPWLGSLYEASFGGSRETSNVSIQSLSPEYNSSWSIGFTQPLLRNLIWNTEWTRVNTTRTLYHTSLEGFRKDVMDVVQRIQNLYWNLIAREDQVRVAEKSLETARALLSQTQTQYDVGVVSRVEVVEAEAGVAQRDFDLIRAQNLYRNSQDELIDAVLGTGLTADSTLQIQPTDRPDDYIPFDIDPEHAVESAFENRPEVKQADLEIERRDIELRFARNQRLPSLDAHVAYGNEGLGGRTNPACSPFASTADVNGTTVLVPAAPGSPCLTNVPSRWGSSTDDFFTGNAAAQFSARALVSIPIPNTSARARVSQAELELRRANSLRRRLEQSIILEVRTAIRNLTDSQKGIEAARRATAAAQEQLRAERIRLEYGESTPFDVLLRESDLVRAQSEEINAFQVYRTSATGLDRAQGTILRNSNVSIDAVRALR